MSAKHGDDAVFIAHSERFSKIESMLADVREDIVNLDMRADRVYAELSLEDGSKSFVGAIREYLARQDEVKKALIQADIDRAQHLELASREAERRDLRMNTRFNLIIAITSILAVLIAALLYLHAVEDSKKGLLNFPQVFPSHSSERSASYIWSKQGTDRGLAFMAILAYKHW